MLLAQGSCAVTAKLLAGASVTRRPAWGGRSASDVPHMAAGGRPHLLSTWAAPD